jgi:hypothetical protein
MPTETPPEVVKPDAGLNPGRLLLELAGAAAGILVFVNLVGALVWSARLDALGLSVESTVALLPSQTILLAGVGLLLPSLALGLVLVFWLSLLRSRTMTSEWLTPWRRTCIGALAAVIIALIAYFPGSQSILPSRLALAAITLATVLLAFVIAARGPSVKSIGAALFTLIALYSGWAGYERATDAPVDLSYAVIHTGDGGRTQGYLLARSGDEVILAPEVAGRTIRRISVLRRGDIVDLRLGPGRVGGVLPLGPFHGQSNDSEPGVPPPPVADHEDTMARARVYLASVRGSTLWKYPPVTFDRSMGLWQTQYADFAGYTPVPWREQGVPATLEELNEETIAFDGVAVITEGVVLVATPLRSFSDRVVRQFVAIRSPRSEDSRAVCPIARDAGDPRLRGGDHVRLRAIVLAAGIFVGGSGTEGRRVAMVCAAATPVPQGR